MGVHGLWRLIDATGKPVPLETLEGKVLAIDISIWIHQVIQGYQDRHGNPKPNAHLIGLFNRICKLLYYKIKPVFVFDGGVPMLKKTTIKKRYRKKTMRSRVAARRKQKSIATSKAQKMKTDLINDLIKHAVVKSALNKANTDGKIESFQMTNNICNKPSKNDIYMLPELTNTDEKNELSSDESDSSIQLSPRKLTKWMGNIHNVDLTTAEFKLLPADVRYDILTDLKETRKQSSWGRLHEMPEKSSDFYNFQMKRLLKRRFVQESLESTEKEMGGKTLTLDELDKLLTAQGVQTHRDTAYRIASDSTSRVIYINDKEALMQNSAENKTNKDNLLNTINEEFEPIAGPSGTATTHKSLNEFHLNEGNSDSNLTGYSSSVSIMDNLNEYEFDSDWESETESNESLPLPKKYLQGKRTVNPALTYMLEHSGLTQEQIMQLIEQSKKENKRKKSDTYSITSENSLVRLGSYVNDTENQKKQQKTEKPLMNGNEENEKKICTHKIDDSNLNFETFTEKIEDHCNNPYSAKDTDNEVLDKETVECQSQPTVNSMTDIDNIDMKETIECQSQPTANSMTNIDNIDMKETIECRSQPTVNPMTDIDHINMTDSDSDDFIEIPDVPVPNSNFSKKAVEGSGIEITFKPNEKMENDLFSDVFTESNEKILSQSTESVSSSLVKQSISTSISHDLNKNKNEQESEVSETSKTCVSYETSSDKISKICEDQKVQETELSILNEENLVQIEKSQENKTFKDSEIVVIDDTPKLSEDSISIKPVVFPTNETELLQLKANLEDEQNRLIENIGKLERQATDITDQIRIEAQELLRLFGCPYIIAPMEAEAQCAYLEQIKLTDGTITDDSDIWLFGGQCVYKNFFHNNKTVLRFQYSDIQHHFKLSRQQMIQLALLVGSDYTTGISGIGPVTALEILATFPAQGDNSLQGLINFCSWIQKDRAIDNSRNALRNKLQNVKIERGFPSQAVVQAYLFPSVDESKEKFTWGQPNTILLTDYAMKKFGWSKDKFEKIIKPVLKRVEESKQLKTLEAYFKVKTIPKSIEMKLSTRIKKAVERLNNEDIESNTNEANLEEKTKANTNKRVRKSQNKKENNCEDIGFVESSNIAEEVLLPNVSIKKNEKSSEEYIPQREKNKANALKKKLHAIEVLRKSKFGVSKTKKTKRNIRKTVKEAKLSESSDSN